MSKGLDEELTPEWKAIIDDLPKGNVLQQIRMSEFEKFKEAVKVIVSVPKKKVIKKPKAKKVSKKTNG